MGSRNAKEKTMNIKELHVEQRAVSAVSLFKGENSTVNAIQIQENETLKEHSSKVPALLLCVEGEVVFENENGEKHTLKSGDYTHIEPNIKHWLVAHKTSQLILIK